MSACSQMEKPAARAALRSAKTAYVSPHPTRERPVSRVRGTVEDVPERVVAVVVSAAATAAAATTVALSGSRHEVRTVARSHG